MDSIHVSDLADDIADEDPVHAHGENEIYHVDSGAAKINVEGDTTTVSEGDVVTVLYAPAKGSSD